MKNYLSFFFFLCLVMMFPLCAHEGSEGSEDSDHAQDESDQSPATVSKLEKKLLDILSTYETTILKTIPKYANQQDGKLNISFSAQNDLGQKATININAHAKVDIEQQKFWMKLTGDLGEALMTMTGNQGHALLPLFSMYSKIDTKDVQANLGNTEPLNNLESMVKSFFREIKKKVKTYDERKGDNRLTWEQPEEYLNEGCDVFSAVMDQNGKVKLFVSQNTNLLRGVHFSKESQGTMTMDIFYNGLGLPTKISMLTDDQSSVMPMKAEISLGLKYADMILNSFDFKMNAKTPQDVKLLWRVAGQVNNNIAFKDEDFNIGIDAQTMREVDIQMLGQNLMMGSVGKLMEFQSLLMPQGVGVAPGGPAEGGVDGNF